MSFFYQSRPVVFFPLVVLLLFVLPLELPLGESGRPLQAQAIPSSGYSGLFTRFQLGMAYSELTEDYEDDDRRYYSTGPYVATQIGWAISKSYAIHMNLSGFSSSSGSGPERQERSDEMMIEKTDHSYVIGFVGLGFTWFHLSSAVYISPVLHLFQSGRRKESQRIYNNPANGQYSLIEVETSYASRFGYGIMIGNDRWLSKSVGVGLVFSLQQDHMLAEKQKFKTTTEPSGVEQENRESDLNRVSSRSLLFSLSLNITYN